MANFISEDNIEQALLQRLQHVRGFNALTSGIWFSLSSKMFST